jgi:hypothetical protein
MLFFSHIGRGELLNPFILFGLRNTKKSDSEATTVKYNFPICKKYTGQNGGLLWVLT